MPILLFMLAYAQYPGLGLIPVMLHTMPQIVIARHTLDCFASHDQGLLCLLPPWLLFMPSTHERSSFVTMKNPVNQIPLLCRFAGRRVRSCLQVLLGLPYDGAIDIWSLGCISVELFLGLPIFPGVSDHNQICRIVEMTGSLPDFMLENGKDTLKFFKRVRRNWGVRFEVVPDMRGEDECALEVVVESQCSYCKHLSA